MSIKLSFSQEHLSIKGMEDITLPALTVLTGLNGSGKTHLLQSILGGQTKCFLHYGEEKGWKTIQTQSIKILENGDSKRKNLLGGHHNTDSAITEVMTHELNDQIRSMRIRIAQKLQILIDDTSITEARFDTLVSSSPEDVFEQLKSDYDCDLDEIRTIFDDAETDFTKLKTDTAFPIDKHSIEMIKDLSAKCRIPIRNLNLDDFPHYFTENPIDVLQANIASVYGRYRDAFYQNELAQKKDERFGTSTSLSDVDFQNIYKVPPWDRLNNLFDAFGLPIASEQPELYSLDKPVTANLMHKRTGKPVSVANLSSGEQVILELALSTFDFASHGFKLNKPLVLLMDEMDASLNPQLQKQWLTAISDILVEQKNIRCILTTHSPTTVAMAPEESLYEIDSSIGKLEKVSKQAVLNKLTFGIPTLSIDISGRFQVFVESDTDAKIFERIYSIIKGRIELTKELNFLSTGIRQKDNKEVNSGCEVVKKLVKSLRDSGNSNIFGIVDWDGKAKSTEFIKVVAENVRDGIENVILDPLLVGLFLIKIGAQPKGINSTLTFRSFGNLTNADLQSVVDAVQYKIFKEHTINQKVNYLGGVILDVGIDYLKMDDHDLEETLSNEFPELMRWSSRGRGKLSAEIVTQVLTEYPEFCPKEFVQVFEIISNYKQTV